MANVSSFLGDRDKLNSTINSMISNISSDNTTTTTTAKSRYKPNQINTEEFGLAESLRPRLRPVNLKRKETKGEHAPSSSLRPQARPMSLEFADPAAISSIPGLSENELSALIAIESAGKGYTAENKDSKAYGKYQFVPKTAKEWAGKLGIDYSNWKDPANQDRMFAAFTKDNIRRLQARGLPTDAFHIYGAHQQGIGGLSQILSGNISSNVARNIRSNLPGSSSLSDAELGPAWISYWKGRLGYK